MKRRDFFSQVGKLGVFTLGALGTVTAIELPKDKQAKFDKPSYKTKPGPVDVCSIGFRCAEGGSVCSVGYDCRQGQPPTPC